MAKALASSLGVIQLVNLNMERFRKTELFFLQSLCDYAVIAIENAKWVEKIQALTITDDCTGRQSDEVMYLRNNIGMVQRGC